MLEIEELLETFSSIDEPIIVEGKRDAVVIKELGVKSKIYQISGKKLESVVEEVVKDGWKKVLVLTDFDVEGRKIAAAITRLLVADGVSVDFALRRRIRSMMGSFAKIEEMKFLVKIIKEDDAHGEIGSVHYKICDRVGVLRRWYSRKT